jgi:hypothetical protein
MTNIYQYFTDKLGTAPADDTLRQLPINSNTAVPPEAPTSGFGTFETSRDVRSSVANGEKAEVARTPRFGGD